MIGSHDFPTFGKQLFPIIAALPIFAGNVDEADHYLLVCQVKGISRNDTPEYVVATADSLSASEWHSGTYTSDLAKALTLMYAKSGIKDLMDVL